MGKVKKLTAAHKRNLLKKAKKLGFKNKVNFISATGMPEAFVKGRLVVKENYSDEEELQFNGDVVSTSGVGVIYDASTDRWGTIVEY